MASQLKIVSRTVVGGMLLAKITKVVKLEVMSFLFSFPNLLNVAYHLCQVFMFCLFLFKF